MCKSCDEQLQSRACPTCKLDISGIFGPKRIRNRAVEDIIGKSMTSCEHCKQPMTRAELALHTPCALYVNRLVKKEFGDRVETYRGQQGSEELAQVALHNGETKFYDAGKVVRKEFRSPHEQDGCTEFFKDGKFVCAHKKNVKMRCEYRPHKADGITSAPPMLETVML